MRLAAAILMTSIMSVAVPAQASVTIEQLRPLSSKRAEFRRLVLTELAATIDHCPPPRVPALDGKKTALDNRFKAFADHILKTGLAFDFETASEDFYWGYNRIRVECAAPPSADDPDVVADAKAAIEHRTENMPKLEKLAADILKELGE